MDNVRYIYNYENLKAEKGEPIREMMVKRNDPNWVVIYDDITVVYDYHKLSEDRYFMWAQINSDTYMFGNKKIAVGMSRERIEKILRNSKRPIIPEDKMRLYDAEGELQYRIVEKYYNDNYDFGLGFVYDENDCVEYIYWLK